MHVDLRPDFELLFEVTMTEIMEHNARWSDLRRDIKELLLRRAESTNTPGEQRPETIIKIYGAPLHNEGAEPTDADRVVFREIKKHLQAKYPEFLPLPVRRIPSAIGHVREI